MRFVVSHGFDVLAWLFGELQWICANLSERIRDPMGWPGWERE